MSNRERNNDRKSLETVRTFYAAVAVGDAPKALCLSQAR